MTRRKRVLAAWAGTRLGALALMIMPFYPTSPTLLTDVEFYEKWSLLLEHGTFPVGDEQWQYPPLAGAILVVPRLIGGPYGPVLLCCMLAVDLLVLVSLLGRGRQRAGAWAWVAGPFLLGPMIYQRYDLVVAALAVVALLMLPRMRAFGVLVALGALVKVWPALLLLVLPRARRSVRALAAFGGTCAVCVLGSAIIFDGAWDFLNGQRGRGLEVEAIAATPFQIARSLGWPGEARYQYGSVELVGPGIGVAAALSLLLTVAGLGLVGWIALRRPPARWDPAYACDVALAVTLVAMVTSRVLSPQYFIWALGVGAACLTHAGTRQRGVMLVLLACALLTQIEYPIAWTGVDQGEAPAVALLTVRNMLLLAATVGAVAVLRERGAPAEAGREDAPGSRAGDRRAELSP